MNKRISLQKFTRQSTHYRKVEARLKEAEAALSAIAGGQIDAVMVTTEQGNQVQSLEGMDNAYRTLIENLTEGIVTIDADDFILYSNHRFAELLHIAPEKIICSSLTEWIAPADRPVFQALKQTVLESRGQEYAEISDKIRGEIRFIYAGLVIPVQISLKLMDLNGKISCCCVINDLTEKKLASLVLEQASEAIIVCNGSAQIISASAAALSLCRDSFLGQIFSQVFPLHRVASSAVTLFDLSPVLHGERVQCEVMLSQESKAYYFLLNAAPLISQEKPASVTQTVFTESANLTAAQSVQQTNLQGAIVTLTDITALKKTQQLLMHSVQRYRSLTLATPQMIWLADAGGQASADNAGWREYTGQSMAQMSHDGWINVVHPDDRARSMATWRQAVLSGTGYTEKFRLRRFDGAYRYHLLRGVPVRTTEGSIQEWIGTAQDIHEEQQGHIRLQIEHAVACLLAESADMAQTMQEIIRTFCQTFQWQRGERWVISERDEQAELYKLNESAQPAMQIAESWPLSIQSSLSVQTAQFIAEVLRKKLPQWSLSASGSELKSELSTEFSAMKMFAFPVLNNTRVLAVFCFFYREIGLPELALSQTALSLGRQIGLFLLRKQAESNVSLRNRALEASNEAVFIARCGMHSNQIEYVNPAFEKISGYSEEMVLGMDLMSVQQKLCRDQSLQEIKDALYEKRAGHCIMHNYRADGSRFWSDLHIAPVYAENPAAESRRSEKGNEHQENREITHFIGIQNDISESMRYQSELEYQANHDALTGLPNRNLLNDRLQRAISAAQRNDRLMALAFVDLDSFKLINDTLGHDAGDVVLKTIAKRLISCLRDADTAARPGGDEFLLILVEQESIESISAVIRRILEMIALPIALDLPVESPLSAQHTPAKNSGVQSAGNADLLTQTAQATDAQLQSQLQIESQMELQDTARSSEGASEAISVHGRDLHVTCSIGISIYLQDGNDVSTLLKNADTAMYHAKERGRNNFQFFNAAMNQRVHERFTLEANLRQAIFEQHLSLYYQPQFEIASGRMIGVEALLRWQHKEIGMIPPSRFIPIAEESGLIIPLGQWVLKTACAQAKSWQEQGFAPLTMAVNISARQFKNNNLALLVRQLLDETGLSAEFLELELTESLALENSEKFMRTLKELKSLGLQLTLDDFGTGYSSLSYLRHLPLDRLKIDISFIHDIALDVGDAAIAQIIIMLGHSMQLKVIAEGVETLEQLNLLRVQGCDEMQGFFSSQALPVLQMENFMRQSLHMESENIAPVRH